MADHKTRYAELLAVIAGTMFSDPRAALRAEFELVTLAYADRWREMRLDAGATTESNAQDAVLIRANGLASRQALADLQALLDGEA